MKTLLRFSLAVLGICLMAASAPAQGRLATVDMRKVFRDYWKTKQAEALLKERREDLDKERKGLVDDFNKGREEYQKLLTGASDQAVSSEEREKRKKAAEAKLKELKDLEDTIGQFERTANETLAQQSGRMRGNILELVRTAVTAKAKATGYTLVMDVSAESAGNTPIILYTNNENDLTDGVLKDLNADAPAASPKPGEKPAEKK